jgi:hypothetical protein
VPDGVDTFKLNGDPFIKTHYYKEMARVSPFNLVTSFQNSDYTIPLSQKTSLNAFFLMLPPPAGTEVVRETKIGTGAFERNFPEVHWTPATFSTAAP